MTILNFPANPSDGDVYTANGINYTYNNGAWSSNSIISGDERYVLVTGDNMTGALTVGGGSDDGGLTLNTNGSIDTSGRVTAAGQFNGLRFKSINDDSIASYLGQINDYDGTTYQLLIVDESDGGADNNPKVTAGIKADGSITAVGRLVIEGSQAGASLAKIRNTAGSASSNGLNISTSSTGVLALDIGYNIGSGYNQTCTIQADGSIEAAGDVEIGNGNVTLGADGTCNFNPGGNSQTDAGITFSNDGLTTIYRPTGSDVSLLDLCSGPSSKIIVSSVMSDGTTKIGGTLTGSSQAPNISLNADGSISAASGNFTVAATGDTRCLGGSAWTLGSSGNANFAGNVTANGSILTLSSGNLDVGDRLKKADDALQALKTAAAASSDFASLKAAIASALANI